VLEVRGAGLLVAARLSGEWAKAVTAKALDRGLLVNAVRPDTVRLAPPLLVSDTEIDQALAILRAVLVEAVTEEGR
jgi:acetylornithine/succinyldiaminopimelate/putrescine aminotransferase